jgi:hypothetical protein
MTVTVTQNVVVTEKNTTLNVTVMNSGNEAAYDVQLSLILPEGFTTEPIFAGVLQPNVPYMGSFRVGIDDSAKPGTYPVVVKTHYADANAYPFSTVTPTFIRYGQPTPFKLRGAIKEVSLVGDSKKDIVLEVSNLDNKPHDVLVRFHLPDELAADYYSTEAPVQPHGISEVRVPVKSFGALPDSSYVIFASMEYDEGGLHYSSTAGGMIKILAKEVVGDDMPSWVPLAVLVALIALFIYLQIRK